MNTRPPCCEHRRVQLCNSDSQRRSAPGCAAVSAPAAVLTQRDSDMAAKNELLYLVLQLLKEEGLTDAAHALEQSSGIYFDAKHFEELVIAGSWDPAEKYLLGFTGWEANGSSLKMFFELRKQKYLEALDRRAAASHMAAGVPTRFSAQNSARRMNISSRPNAQNAARMQAGPL